MDITKEVMVRILGNSDSFKSHVKDVEKLTSDLQKSQEKYAKSPRAASISGQGKKMASHQKEAGKIALQLEKKLQKAIKDSTREIEKKKKAQRGVTAEVKAEMLALAKVEGAYKRIQTYRKGTGTRSMGERFKSLGSTKIGGGGGGGAGAALGGAMVATALAGLITKAIGGVVNLVRSHITQGYQAYTGFAKAQAGLSGMGAMKNSGATFAAAQRLGFSSTETVGHMRGVGRATGNINAVGQAQLAARAYGGDVSEVTGFMGTLTKGGQGFGGLAGRGGERQLRQVMQHAFTSGLDKSRAGEHLAAVAQGVQSAQSVTGGRVDASSISGMLSFFGRSGQPGLQGAAGMGQLSKIDASVKRAGFGGGGDPASALMYQAMDFGHAGGNTSFYDATKRLQRGIMGEGGSDNLMAVFNRFAETGGGANTEKTNLEISKATGLSLDVVESIWKAIQDNGTGTEGAAKAIAEITKQQLPVEEQLLNATKDGHLAQAAYFAGLENRLVDIGKLAAADMQALQTAINRLVNELMPAALVVLHQVAQAVTGIWEWVHEFRRDFMSASGAEESLDKLEFERAQTLQMAETGAISTEVANARLKKINTRAQSIQGDLRDTTLVGDLARAADHVNNTILNETGITGALGRAERPSALETHQQARRRADAAVAQSQRTAITFGRSGLTGRARTLDIQGQDLQRRIGQAPKGAQRSAMQTELSQLREQFQAALQAQAAAAAEREAAAAEHEAIRARALTPTARRDTTVVDPASPRADQTTPTSGTNPG